MFRWVQSLANMLSEEGTIDLFLSKKYIDGKGREVFLRGKYVFLPVIYVFLSVIYVFF